MLVKPVVLTGNGVRLEPLETRHFETVAREALEHPEIWAHMPFRVRDRDDVARLFLVAEKLQEAQAGVAFATYAGDRVVGGTTIRLVDAATPSVEIGATWIVPAFQRTHVNTEAKLLQLAHAFESLGVARVEFKTDVKNARSRTALARLGATEEGTFRQHMRRQDGTLRDSVYFSIVATEWPEVKKRLRDKLLSHSAFRLSGMGETR
jgi:RimJ/RimL family protein N-acetyltransferase